MRAVPTMPQRNGAESARDMRLLYPSRVSWMTMRRVRVQTTGCGIVVAAIGAACTPDASRSNTLADGNPRGPEHGQERVLRGGSWMCSDNFCTNYRPGARSSATPDTGLNNLGFRCVKDAETTDEPSE
ncbi:MAG: SUMF1/EgtB/PvdO family nonheme iron enzyme [Luteitalea sp.]|nr:SUMF1/EgtB/PvdO family nonheme iron enzyme [Luteitalea sp.]